jgi:hypothetical protein
VRPLAAHGKVSAMAQSAIALNFDQAPHVHLHLLAEIAFDAAFSFDRRAQMRHFLFGEVLDLLGGVDVRLFGERTRALLPDAIDCRDGGRSTPAIRAISLSSLRFLLALALAVFRVYANHAHHTAPMNDLALHANFLDRCSNLHRFDSVLSLPSAAKAAFIRCGWRHD